MPQLYHISYMSDAKTHAFEPDLRVSIHTLGQQCLRNNARLGLTGCLFFADGKFFQSLEGEADDVEDTFGRISRDSRHKNLRVLSEGYIPERTFAGTTVTAPDCCLQLASEVLQELSHAVDTLALLHLHTRELETLLAVVTQSSRRHDFLLNS
ncbi:BLUF domain-containing protein [Pannonibacter sp. Pt2-lr]|uniref:BLUF domain-containing protein n=1 Tax=Pannonibacter anstelovis TaxID=3121537 RepID=A0ABU7ZIV4_9HYPH